MSRELAEIIDRNMPRSTKYFLSPRATKAHVAARDMGVAGFTQKRIAKETGLTPGQVSYLLKTLGISTLSYRRGESPLAQAIIKLIHEDSTRYFNTIVSNVRRYLKD